MRTSSRGWISSASCAMRFDLSDERTVRAVLSRHGFSFSKALGQNFLIDPTVCPEMARAATREGADCVLEIGPGIGVLTASLCEQAKQVVAVELDRRLFPVLRETLADYDNVELVEGDAMQLDLHALLRERFGEGARAGRQAPCPCCGTGCARPGTPRPSPWAGASRGWRRRSC